ncbi:hypothetical protein Tco_1140361, partial [Tanacetum coccineum]
FRKKYTGVQYRNLFWKAAKATYPTSTDKACDAVENRISECFNAMIVDARRKPIINMLEDIRVLCMERLQKMREKHAKWTDGICPNIRKKLEKYKDLHRFEVTASGDLVSAKGGNVTTRGGKVCARGGKVTAMGGIVMASGGNVTARGGKVTASGGKVTARGGKVSARGGKVAARGGKATSTPPTPSTPPPVFEMSTPDTASSAVRISGCAIKLREGVWIRSPEKERSSYEDTRSSSINKLRTVNGKVVSSRGRGDGSKSRMYPFGIRPIGFGVSWDPIDGQTMLGNSMDLPRHAWPEGITPQDCIIHAATQSEIALSHSQPVESQEDEPRHQEPRQQQQQPRQQQQRQQQQRNQEPRQQLRRTLERIVQIMFNNPPTPGPGLDPDDAISLE